MPTGLKAMCSACITSEEAKMCAERENVLIPSQGVIERVGFRYRSDRPVGPCLSTLTKSGSYCSLIHCQAALSRIHDMTSFQLAFRRRPRCMRIRMPPSTTGIKIGVGHVVDPDGAAKVDRHNSKRMSQSRACLNPSTSVTAKADIFR